MTSLDQSAATGHDLAPLRKQKILPKRWFCGVIGDGASQISFPTGAKAARLSESHSLWTSEYWPETEVQILRDARACVVVLGESHQSNAGIAAGLLESVSLKEGASIAARAYPNANVVVDVLGRLVINSDVAGLHTISFRSYRSGYMYSDSSLLLGLLCGDRASETWFASYLTASDVLGATLSLSAIEHVNAVPAGHYLDVKPGDEARVRRYWQAPDPMLSFEEGVDHLREALIRAVDRRVDIFERPSADMSGGFDSTTLAWIASRRCAESSRSLPVIIGAARGVPGYDDLDYAQDVVKQAGNITSWIFDMNEVPEPLDHLGDDGFLAEEPSLLTCTATRFAHLLGAVRRLDSDGHLSGQGGDAVLEAPTGSYLPDLVRQRRYRRLLQHARLAGGPKRKSAAEMIRHALAVNRLSLDDWLRDQAGALTDGSPGGLLGWGNAVRRPSWLTTKAVELASAHLENEAVHQTPHGPTPGQHCAVAAIIGTARACRLAEPLATASAVNLEYPFFDASVMQACLSVHPSARTTGQRLKPLLASAFARDLPRGFFDRSKKTSPWFFTRAVYAAIRDRHHQLDRLFGDPLLAQLGLIEPAGVRASIAKLEEGSSAEFGAVIDVIAAEVWLRRFHVARGSA